jgi:predicted transcriptional regulator
MFQKIVLSKLFFLYYNYVLRRKCNSMNVEELIRLVDGKLCTTPVNLAREIKGGCGADLMSDVLASIQPEAVLLTGLCNPQVVRTAQMADVAAVVLVRGKQPPKETVDLANQEGIPLIITPYGMFELCGRLYQAGLSSLEMPVTNGPCTCE